MEFGVFALVAIAAVAAAALSFYAKRRRQQELAMAARQYGLSFSPADTQGCLGLPFALFMRGEGRGTENVMWGTWKGMAVREFDYWYFEESRSTKGRRARTYQRFSCAVTEIDAACSPLSIVRENLLTRLADAVALDDITFELDEFNRGFDVRSKDRRFANDFVDQRMMRFLLGSDPSFGFEASGRWLLCFSRRRRPLDLIPLLGTVRGFRDHVPSAVLDLYGLRSNR